MVLVSIEIRARDKRDTMSDVTSKACGICGVTIETTPGGDRVNFSYGPPGDRAKLWSRVCKFVSDRPGCLNQDKDAIGTIDASAAYNPEPNAST